MFGATYRNLRRKLRWLARAVGVFCGFFAFEYISANPHPQVFGAIDPYAGAVAGYLIGSVVLTLVVVWLLGRVTGLFLRLLGRR